MTTYFLLYPLYHNYNECNQSLVHNDLESKLVIMSSTFPCGMSEENAGVYTYLTYQAKTVCKSEILMLLVKGRTKMQRLF